MAGLVQPYNAPRMAGTASSELLGLAPGSCVGGSFRPPASTSLAQRALLAGAAGHGITRLASLPETEDVRAALAVLAAAGVEFARDAGGAVRVPGVPPGVRGGLRPQAPVPVGESSTLARLATALLALASRPGERWVVSARGSLLAHRSRPLFRALTVAGVELVRQNLPGTWPVELVACVPPPRLELAGPVSSQEVSGLLFALAAHPEARELAVAGRIPDARDLRPTLELLADFDARVEHEDQGSTALFRVRGPLRAPPAELVLEPDASSAAVALAAACLTGGELRVPGLGPRSRQSEVRIVEHLAAFGCDAGHDAQGLRARGFPRHGAVLDLGDESGLAPVLCAVAAGAALRNGAPSELRGLATLPDQESDRLGGLARALAAIGLAVEAGTDSLRVAPGEARAAAPVVLDPRGDDRMACAFALLGCLRPGVLVRDPHCVAGSWGTFWSDLEALGARLARPA